jgi:nitrogen fixation NifU-like protein
MNLEVAREILLKHSRSSANGAFPSTFHFAAQMTNPLCGDHVEIRLRAEEQQILELGHKASACAIGSASASLVAEKLKGYTLDDVQNLTDLFINSISEAPDQPWPEALDDFRCFEHLRSNPSRRMCAALPWLVLKSALNGERIAKS